jgi:DNA mismatch endonuclease (patch repair protein)
MTTQPTQHIDDLRAIVRNPPRPSSYAARRVMIGNGRRDSTPEVELRRALHRAGRRYRVDFPLRVTGRRPIRPDIVFTRARVAVFVDGCFWHGCQEHGTRPQSNSEYWAAKIEINQTRDREQTTVLEREGWTVVRIWEHEAPGVAIGRIAAALDDQAASGSGAAISAESSDDATA